VQLPADFLRNIRNSFGNAGEQWLADLPWLLDEASRKWDLVIGEPLLLSYNYVTAAKRHADTDVVLKLGVPDHEFSSELSALRHFNADGCVRLLEADDDRFMFLLERLKPGMMLADIEDDEKRTHIACDVMTRLWRPAPMDESPGFFEKGLPFIKLVDWFAKLAKLRSRYAGGSGPFPQKFVERVESLLPELFAESTPAMLIHGDLHHFNILSSERGWLAIDPKGVIGPPEYECGPLLINPVPRLLDWPDALKITQRRIAILSERLGFPRERICEWGFCHAMLSAWWDLADDDTGGVYSLACAEMFARA
jgi:streptomycin 6-kinase